MQDCFLYRGKLPSSRAPRRGIAGNRPRFAQYAPDIVASISTDERLQKLQAEVDAEKRRCLVLNVDLIRPENITGCRRRAQAMGRIDILPTWPA